MRLVLATILFLLLRAAPGFAVPPAEQEEAERIYKGTPGSASVWALDKEKAVLRHIQSGLLCPARLRPSGVELWHLFNEPSRKEPGTDVGCDYGRLGKALHAEIMLSVYVAKAAPDETLDEAFQRNRADFLAYYEDARPKGPLRLAKDPAAAVDDRTELFDIAVNKVPMQASLTVSLVKGWVLEVRATYRKPGASAADRSAAALAWRGAVESVGRTGMITP